MHNSFHIYRYMCAPFPKDTVIHVGSITGRGRYRLGKFSLVMSGHEPVKDCYNVSGTKIS